MNGASQQAFNSSNKLSKKTYPMGKINVELGQTYSFKVLDIKYIKEVTKKIGLRYRFDITLEDKKGDTIVGEWLSPTNPQDAFVPGVIQFMRVGFISSQGTPEIEPAEDPKASASGRGYVPPKADIGKDSVDKFVGPQPSANPYNINISGRAITFATAYAKDLLIEEMKGWATDRTITDDDLARMGAWAGKIADGMTEKMTF